MSRKTAAFMSPQAAIAKGQENSKGWKKNPMKLIYNFDAHKKTASEGMFSNPSSEIPDEMWRAATPMQRQADAVVLWAELTGKHASNCGNHGPAKPKKKTVKKASYDLLGLAKAREGIEELRSRQKNRDLGLPSQVSAEELRARLEDIRSSQKVMNPKTMALLGGIGGAGYGLALSPFVPQSRLTAMGGGAAMGALGSAAGTVAADALTNVTTVPYLERLIAEKSASVGPNRLSQADIAGARPLSSAPPRTRARLMMLRKTMPKAMYSRNRDTGIVYKLASAKAQKLVQALAARPEAVGAGIGAGVGGTKGYLDHKKGKGGVSKAEAAAIGDLAAARAQKADPAKIKKIKARLATVRSKKDSLKKEIAKGTAVGALAGALSAHAIKRGRKAAAERSHKALPVPDPSP